MKNKLIVLGLDGAGYELIMPWINTGKLPNIQRILKHGVYADSAVCLPPVTCPNWKCYSTGKNPGKLGMFWWRNISIQNQKEYYPSARINMNKEIWDYLSKKNFKVAVINMPTTYPSKKVNGIFISGGGDCLDKEYTYPPQLKTLLAKKYKYRINATRTNRHMHTPKEMYKDIIDVFNKRFALLKDLIKEQKYDFLHLTLFHINTLHHNLWDSEYTLKAWQNIDKHIGEIIKLTKNKSNILLMSDHGANEIKVVFNITSWLEKKGYFKRRNKKTASLLKWLKIDRQKIYAILKLIGITPDNISKIFSKKTRKHISKYIPSQEGMLKSKEGNINWKKTKVLATGQGPIYININKKSKEYELLKCKLKKELEELKNPITNEKIAKKVYEKEEIYSGAFLDEAPDLIIDQAAGVHINGSLPLSKDKLIFEKPYRWIGENKAEGIFACYGPDIKNAGKLKNVSILDFAPTILYLYNITIPKDIDGKILEIFKNKKYAARYAEEDILKKIKV